MFFCGCCRASESGVNNCVFSPSEPCTSAPLMNINKSVLLWSFSLMRCFSHRFATITAAVSAQHITLCDLQHLCMSQEWGARETSLLVNTRRRQSYEIQCPANERWAVMILFSACFMYYLAASWAAVCITKHVHLLKWEIQWKTAACRDDNDVGGAHTCHTSRTPPQTCSREARITYP